MIISDNYNRSLDLPYLAVFHDSCLPPTFTSETNQLDARRWRRIQRQLVRCTKCYLAIVLSLTGWNFQFLLLPCRFGNLSLLARISIVPPNLFRHGKLAEAGQFTPF